jgi:hypothetical protein
MSVGSNRANNWSSAVRYALETTRAVAVCPFHCDVLIRIRDDRRNYGSRLMQLNDLLSYEMIRSARHANVIKRKWRAAPRENGRPHDEYQLSRN